MGSKSPALELKAVCKKFGDLKANNRISLSLYGGKVTGLVGENGAGKTTLMSILSGQLQPDSGTIHVHGKSVKLGGPHQAREAGIGLVYQDIKLVETMTVGENVLLVKSPGLFSSRKKSLQQLENLVNQFGLSIHLEQHVADLSMAEKQQVEILKMLHQNSDIMLFDEPTSLLSEQEVDRFFNSIRALSQDDRAIVFISHKLTEVLAVADEIYIIKDGIIVEHLAATEHISVEELAAKVKGNPLSRGLKRKTMQLRQTILHGHDLDCGGKKSVSLRLRKGEVFSIVGKAGNGQRELADQLSGRVKLPEGSLSILGEDSSDFFSSESYEQMMSYIPADRFGLATGRKLDLLDTFLLTTSNCFTQAGWLDRKTAREKLEQLLDEFNIRVSHTHLESQQLSGGNLQKLIFARAFYTKPRLLIIEHPTQGLDVEAAADIHQLILQSREQAGVLVFTADISEAMDISDRIAVMFEGRFVDTFAVSDHKKCSKLSQMIEGVA